MSWTEVTPGVFSLSCDGWCDSTGTVSHIDTAGYIYCAECGLTRRLYEPCRKLQPWEVRRLQRGKPLTRY